MTFDWLCLRCGAKIPASRLASLKLPSGRVSTRVGYCPTCKRKTSQRAETDK